MGLQEWKEKYYPQEADKCTGSAVLAIEHSIRKWEGLTLEALAACCMKHPYDSCCIYEEDRQTSFEAAAISTCALCALAHYGPTSKSDCTDCPLFHLRGNACYAPLAGEDVGPYAAWTERGDAQPMLQLLRQALVEAKETEAADALEKS